MCKSCYIKYGSPTFKPAAIYYQIIDYIYKVYEYNGAGGNAHIVLDDWNLEDTHIDWCLNNIHDKMKVLIEDQQYTGMLVRKNEDTLEQLEAEKKCLILLRNLTLQERAYTLALLDGYIKEDATSTIPETNTSNFC